MKSIIWFLFLAIANASYQCMNFYGMETDRLGYVCDWQHPPRYYLDKLKSDININTIRLPFSYEYIKSGDLSILDSFIDQCKQVNMEVILDYHRTWKSHQGPQPEEGISREEFIASWKFMASRFHDRSHVTGIGIFNEYQGEDTAYLVKMHNDVIHAIESEHPGRYIYFVGCTGWGGNCSGMDLSHYPVNRSRIMVEVHKYIFSGNSVKSDWDISIPATIPPENWFVGEVGWKNGVIAEREWAEGFLAYLLSRNITNVCAWTIAHSGDTEGWWRDDCETFDYSKAALLKSIWDNNLKRTRNNNFALRGSYYRLK